MEGQRWDGDLAARYSRETSDDDDDDVLAGGEVSVRSGVVMLEEAVLSVESNRKARQAVDWN